MKTRNHIYKSGSPGWWRANAGITLTEIKKAIKRGEATRKNYRDKGWLA